MKHINTLSDFKKLCTIGTMVNSLYHKEFTGSRDEKGNPVYKTIEREPREVSIKQTNAIAFKTTKADGTMVDSWFHFPKSSECSFENGKMLVSETDREGNKSIVLTYWID
jgi:hypothetical protein